MVSTGFILQAARSLSISEKDAVHIGYTATKKIGKAHIRNRTKRRLRAVAREILPNFGLKNTDYVLIGRYNTASLPFLQLKNNLEKSVLQINSLLEKQAKKNEKNSDNSN